MARNRILPTRRELHARIIELEKVHICKLCGVRCDAPGIESLGPLKMVPITDIKGGERS